MMTDHEAIEYFEAIFETEVLGKTDIEAMNIAISALKEREERSKGCEYCAYECFLQDSEDMEITLYLYNHTDSASYDVYPNFCPVCGRPLDGGGE